MAIQNVLEKMTGSYEAMTQPVTVYDDAEATVSESTAVATAIAAAPSTIFGVAQDSNPGIEQLSSFAWRITITYRARQLRTLTEQSIDSWRYNVSLLAQPKILRWAPEIAVFPSNAKTTYGILNWKASGGAMSSHDVSIPTPPTNARGTYIMPASNMTSSFASVLSTLVGTQNQFSIAGYAPKTVFVTSIDTQQLDDDRVQLT